MSHSALTLALPSSPARAWTDTYLERVRKLCEGLGAEAEEAEEGASSKSPLKASVDCDTEVTQHSFTAAMRGAGAVVEA